MHLFTAQVFSSKLEHNSNIRGIKINSINILLTFCIPLGAAKHNTNLLSRIRNFYGETFINSSFTALGIDFDK